MDIQPQPKKASRKKPKTPKKITAEYLHNSGLYYLQRFSASTGQFRAVMQRKVRKSCYVHTDQDFDHCLALIEETIAKFERAGLLNDELYTQGVVASLRRAGKSKNAILTKLKTRGLPSELARSKLEDYDSVQDRNGDARAALLYLRKKKAGPFGETSEEKRGKILAALARAGFSYDTAQYALTMDQDQANEMLDN